MVCTGWQIVQVAPTVPCCLIKPLAEIGLMVGQLVSGHVELQDWPLVEWLAWVEPVES